MRREAAWEYLRGAMWVLPSLAVLLALVAGSSLSLVEVERGSALDKLVFQGTSDDARTLLLGISSTMITVIALVLGLTVVALQLASTQFSPRLLRNFLRDRVNQVVLSGFVATFTYSTAGLYTVGVSAGERTNQYPRLAVTGALILLFVSLLMLVFFVHHLAHSIQIDEIMARVEQGTLRVISHDLRPATTSQPLPERPVWGVAVPAYRSGYIQTVHPEELLRVAAERDAVAAVAAMVGQHVVEGGPLLWVWRSSPEQRPPDPVEFGPALRSSVRLGKERTMEQDVAFGVRQLADVASKALSPAINDPYTAVQAVQHLSVILAALVRRATTGSELLRDEAGALRVLLPARDFDYYLDLAFGQVRRYGAGEPRVVEALLRGLETVGRFCVTDVDRAAVGRQVGLVLARAEGAISQAADLAPVRAHATDVLRSVSS